MKKNAEQNLKWPYIPDHPYSMLITGGFGSGKTNVLFNLKKEQNRHRSTSIEKDFLYA